MKIQFLICAVLLASFASNAQGFMGKGILNGNINYYNFKEKNSGKTTSFYTTNNHKRTAAVNLNIGGYTKPHTALGFTLGYLNTREENERAQGFEQYTYDNSAKHYKIGAFMRNNFMLKEKFGLFLHSSVSFMWGNEKAEEVYYYPTIVGIHEFNNKFKFFNINVSPGILYSLNKHFSLEATFGQLYYTTGSISSQLYLNDSYENTISDFGANLSLSSFTIGLSYYFGGNDYVAPAESK
jgi:outer membrane immunogenic protein